MIAGYGLCKYGGKKRKTRRRKQKGARSNIPDVNQDDLNEAIEYLNSIPRNRWLKAINSPLVECEKKLQICNSKLNKFVPLGLPIEKQDDNLMGSPIVTVPGEIVNESVPMGLPVTNKTTSIPRSKFRVINLGQRNLPKTNPDISEGYTEISHVGGKKRKTHRKKYKFRSTKKKYSGGAAAIHAAEKTWVCRGNIGCARNINIYK